MIWAIKNNERIKSLPKTKANCPLCFKEVISKCGVIKIWHWSHKSNFECDSFGESETEWHYNWKNHFPKECQEVTIKNHRADIKTKQGIVIELQNSPISLKDIAKREEFYGDNLIWILNGQTIAKNVFVTRYDKNLQCKVLKWYWFPKSWKDSTATIYIDFSKRRKDCLFLVTIVDEEKGILIGNPNSKNAFIVKHGGKP